MFKLTNIFEFQYLTYGEYNTTLHQLFKESKNEWETFFPKSDYGWYNSYDEWFNIFGDTNIINSIFYTLLENKLHFNGFESYAKIKKLVIENIEADNLIVEVNDGFDSYVDMTLYYQMLNYTVDINISRFVYDYSNTDVSKSLIPSVNDSTFMLFSRNSSKNDDQSIQKQIGWIFHNIYKISAYNDWHHIIARHYTKFNLGMRPLIEALQEFRMSTSPGTRPSIGNVPPEIN